MLVYDSFKDFKKEVWKTLSLAFNYGILPALSMKTIFKFVFAEGIVYFLRQRL